ncbi:MAG TPA: hypothetical protein VMY35_08940 [Phycisphaerae bacterium]|nr:hypothetical protein [Phycisphaerae bacterium]
MPDTILTGRVRPAPMFRPELRAAIRSGLKTQTRRTVKKAKEYHLEPAKRPQFWGPQDEDDIWAFIDMAYPTDTYPYPVRSPHGKPGDMWYLREPLRPSESGITLYADDGETVWLDGAETITWPWKCRILSSRYMPRRAARTFMVVTDVRCERVQDISEEDAIAEGVNISLADRNIVALYAECRPDLPCPAASQWAFHALWDSINGKRPGCAWADNSWVFAYTFRLATPAEAEKGTKR